MIFTLKKTIKEAPDTHSFIFTVPKSLRWQAGQYLHYTLPHAHPDDRGIERWFTNAAAPYEKHVMITTRIVPKSSSFKKALQKLQPGDTIAVDGLGGDFLVDHRYKKFVFIAGGIGITPFRSMLLDLDHRRKPLNIQLLYANRDQNFPYKKEFEALKQRHPEFRIDYLVSPRRLDEKSITGLVPDLKKQLVYVSGPEPMVEALGKILKKLGLPKKHIKSDFFPGYGWP